MNFIGRGVRLGSTFNFKSEAFWITLIFVVLPLLTLLGVIVIPAIFR